MCKSVVLKVRSWEKEHHHQLEFARNAPSDPTPDQQNQKHQEWDSAIGVLRSLSGDTDEC